MVVTAAAVAVVVVAVGCTSSVTKKYASGLPKMPEARLVTGRWGLRDPEDDGNPNSISIMDVHVR